MKQTDNRQKQIIQSRAQKSFLGGRNPAVKGKEKEHLHAPDEKHESEVEKPAEPAEYHAGPKVGRNDSCPCGSGKKYKKCCLSKNEKS